MDKYMLVLFPSMIVPEGERMASAAAREISFDILEFTPRFAYGDQAEVVEVTGTGDGTALGTGFARFRKAEIPWTVKYDEVLLVLEGNIKVRTPDGYLLAGPYECLWLPKDTELTYIAEDALVFYAIHPANCNEAAS